MAERRLGVGIIGATGFFGTDWYLDGFNKVPEAKVVAVSARNQAKLDALDTDAKRYTDYHDLLADPDVDLTVISTPDVMHHQIVLEAAAAGKHVLCEKPLAINLKQAREMVDAVKKAGKLGFVNFTNRNLPSYQKAKELISTGAIGDVKFARVNVSWGAGLTHREGTPPWRLQAKYAGKQGILGDAGSHALDMLRWLVGDPQSVVCQMQTLEPDRFSGGVVDNADICLMQGTCENGALFSSQVSRVSDSPPTFVTVQVQGTKGTIEATITGIKVVRAGKTEEIPIKQLPYDTVRQPEVLAARYVAMPAITRAILYGEKAPWLATLEDGLHTQAVMEAAERSAETHRWETVPAVE